MQNTKLAVPSSWELMSRLLKHDHGADGYTDKDKESKEPSCLWENEPAYVRDFNMKEFKKRVKTCFPTQGEVAITDCSECCHCPVGSIDYR